MSLRLALIISVLFHGALIYIFSIDNKPEEPVVIEVTIESSNEGDATNPGGKPKKHNLIKKIVPDTYFPEYETEEDDSDVEEDCG